MGLMLLLEMFHALDLLVRVQWWAVELETSCTAESRSVHVIMTELPYEKEGFAENRPQESVEMTDLAGRFP